jgi:preprotein translocase subunit SecA
LIYKLESFKLFEEMMRKINFQIISFLFKSRLPIRDPNQIGEAHTKSTQTGKAGRGQMMENQKKPPNTQINSNNQPTLSRRQRRMRDRGSRR